MWATVVTENIASGLILVIFNSFIHTFMYTYYVFAALGHSSPLKVLLTQAQIVQFIVGIACSFPTHFLSNCTTNAQKLSTAILQLYAVGLIFLFYDFYTTNYTKGNGKGKEKGKAQGALATLKGEKAM